MKKIIALFLTAALLFGMTTTAFAASSFSVSAKATGFTVTLKWSKVKKAAVYIVYKKVGDKDAIPVAYIDKAGYVDGKVSPGQSYSYYVKAINESGYLIMNSKTVKVKTAAPLSSIKELDVAKSEDKLVVSWEKVKGAVDYRIYLKHNGSYELFATVKSQSFSFTPPAGKAFSMIVVAFTPKTRALVPGSIGFNSDMNPVYDVPDFLEIKDSVAPIPDNVYPDLTKAPNGGAPSTGGSIAVNYKDRLDNEYAKVVDTSKIISEYDSYLEQLNATRKKAGAKPVKYDENMCKLAAIKCFDMYKFGYMGHTSPNYGYCLEMGEYFLGYAVGENVLEGKNWRLKYDSVTEMGEDILMQSPSHRANRLNKKYTKFGLATIDINDQVFVVELFAL